MKTRVGYTGGSKANPTYYSLGDHTETLQLDFDPARISFEQLLEIFWSSHNPTRRAWSQQYKSALFYHNDVQKELALAGKERLIAEKSGRFFKQKIHTDILPAQTFYLAEDYHQKYLLQQTSELMKEFRAIYPNLNDLVNSTAAARVNGYVGGYASLTQVENELGSLGLSAMGNEQLLKITRRFHR